MMQTNHRWADFWHNSGPMPAVEIPSEDALDLIAGAGTAAFAIDRFDKIVYWNSGAEKLLGHTAESVIGRACFDVLAGRDPFGNLYCMRDCAIMEAAVRGALVEPYFMEVRTKANGNQRILVRAIALPAPGPSFSCLMHLVESGKSAELDRLIAAMRSAAHPPREGPARPDPLISVSPLTTREREIVNLLSNGYAALNIAARLNLSHATVRNHIQNILRKLEVHSQVEAIALAFRRGWI
jgi:PAS domain S-box-containing protein